MDGTPQLPRGPAPLASMCRHRCWQTCPHASQIGNRPDSIRRNFPCGRALASPTLHRTVCCLDARPGSIWWQKMDARREYAGFLVVLRTCISTIKMQSTANLGGAFLCCFSDCSVCPYRIQRPVCRRAARVAAWGRSGLESCPESDCARSSTSTSATPATGLRRSSPSARKKRPVAAQGRRAGRGASRDLKARFPTTARVSSRPCRM
jgi:hypothetical protein